METLEVKGPAIKWSDWVPNFYWSPLCQLHQHRDSHLSLSTCPVSSPVLARNPKLVPSYTVAAFNDFKIKVGLSFFSISGFVWKEKNVLVYSIWNIYLLRHHLQKCSKIGNCCGLKLPALFCIFIWSQNNAMVKKEQMLEAGSACFIYITEPSQHFIHQSKIIAFPNYSGSFQMKGEI